MFTRDNGQRLVVFFAVSLMLSFGLCADGVIKSIGGRQDTFHRYLLVISFWYAWIALIGLIITLIVLKWRRP